MTRLRDIRSAGALLLGVLVSGCAGDVVEQLHIRPGRFDYLGCPELAHTMQGAINRERDLKTLIARAEKDAFGSVIAAASYQGDLLQAQGEQKMIAEVMHRKSCPADTPPAASPAKPGKPAARR